MRVLITGGSGQLGQALLRSAPAAALIWAPPRAELDLAVGAGVPAAIRAFQPTIIINAAAYTAVDRAEQEPELAWQVNARAPQALAQAARALPQCRLLQLSTDYVFAGQGTRPYQVSDATAPLGIYGASKLAGEHAVLSELGARALIVRTAWLYGPVGRNFMHTMLQLMATQAAVRVVNDQRGTPTATVALAEVLWALAARPELSGVYHWSDGGEASWYEFALAIAQAALARGLLAAAPRVVPISTAEYPTAARRPGYSVLDTRLTVAALGIEPRPWREQLNAVLAEVQHV